MNKTSFGEMKKILELNGSTVAEYLKFESEGRSHAHKQYESFFVLKGYGEVVSGDERFEVKSGDLVTIPPKTKHWMIPNDDCKMEGFLWYRYRETPQNLTAKKSEFEGRDVTCNREFPEQSRANRKSPRKTSMISSAYKLMAGPRGMSHGQNFI